MLRHATLLHVLLRFHTYVMLRCCTFSCASTHTSCYAVARSPALPRVRYATNQNSFLCWWLQSLERNLQATSARKTFQMAKFCPQPEWICKALGRNSTEKKIVIGRNTDFRQTVGLVKNMIPRQFNTHIDCGQDFTKNWKYLCMTQSGEGNALNNLGQPCAWKKKVTFLRNPRRTKLLFRTCKRLYRFSTFEMTFPRNLRRKLLPEI